MENQYYKIENDIDLLECREEAQKIANTLGFSLLDQVRISTAVSEIVRNVLLYAKKGYMYFIVNERELEIIIEDKGPGIEATTNSKKKGLGIGLSGSKSLMDKFSINSNKNAGTKVIMSKFLPKN